MALAAVLAAPAAVTASELGAFGPEGARMREQFWLLPSGDKSRTLRATVFRPDATQSEDARRLPLVVINHGSDESTRVSSSMPVYYWLSRWFVERGYAVVLPQRRGYGATGGEVAEALDTCSATHHAEAANIAADDIDAVVSFMAKEAFIDPDRIVVAGVSTGGWASLALAARQPHGVKAIVNFAGGRGGHAYGQANAICGEDDLIASAESFAATARVPTAWFYARNDSYFGPRIVERLASAWANAGGDTEVYMLPAYRTEGHALADDRAGWDMWGRQLGAFLDRAVPAWTQPELAVSAAEHPPAAPVADRP